MRISATVLILTASFVAGLFFVNASTSSAARPQRLINVMIRKGPLKSPFAVAGGRSLIGRRIAKGTTIPRGVAFVTGQVLLPANRSRRSIVRAVIRCPVGFRFRGLLSAVPPLPGLGNTNGLAFDKNVARSRREGGVRIIAKAHLGIGATVTVGAVCRR